MFGDEDSPSRFSAIQCCTCGWYLSLPNGVFKTLVGWWYYPLYVGDFDNPAGESPFFHQPVFHGIREGFKCRCSFMLSCCCYEKVMCKEYRSHQQSAVAMGILLMKLYFWREKKIRGRERILKLCHVHHPKSPVCDLFSEVNPTIDPQVWSQTLELWYWNMALPHGPQGRVFRWKVA